MDGFIEFLLMVTGSYFWLAFLLGSSLILSSHVDKDDNKFWFSVFCIALFWFSTRGVDMNGTIWLILGIAWIPMGFAWAVLKWHFRVKAVLHSLKFPDNSKKVYMTTLKDKITIEKQKSVVTLWVIFWPISALSTVTLNIVESIEYLVVVQFGKVFRNISERTLEEIADKEIEDRKNSERGNY